MDAKKPERLIDPGKLGESIRSSIEALQKSGAYEKALEEAEQNLAWFKSSEHLP